MTTRQTRTRCTLAREYAADATDALASLRGLASALAGVQAAANIVDAAVASRPTTLERKVELVVARRLLDADIKITAELGTYAASRRTLTDVSDSLATVHDVLRFVAEDSSAWDSRHKPRTKPRRTTLNLKTTRRDATANSLDAVLRETVDGLYAKDARMSSLVDRITYVRSGHAELPPLFTPLVNYAHASELDLGSILAPPPVPAGADADADPTLHTLSWELYRLLDPSALPDSAEGGYRDLDLDKLAKDSRSDSSSDDGVESSSSSSSSSSSDDGPRETVMLPAVPFGAARVRFVDADELTPKPHNSHSHSLRSILKSTASTADVDVDDRSSESSGSPPVGSPEFWKERSRQVSASSLAPGLVAVRRPKPQSRASGTGTATGTATESAYTVSLSDDDHTAPASHARSSSCSSDLGLLGAASSSESYACSSYSVSSELPPGSPPKPPKTRAKVRRKVRVRPKLTAAKN
ncbi:uncharacterized protein AMSG_09691 [Thecamonas trahens ATCC 50062]|uniref:Uncharacterized protein n=1 Tax=Thecamonas trahens ATCC 50062 TaxID=461836 RepID=A0A0L0DPT8_THETB|nr:hypothetical protein AMSG_09691 [Thecamonas trahens ATCC 50062]KNC54031.1 hypothetical protein AMSG_09691 [Thecamonas trahens ATCC 50062]|eukprot:XP_013754044.1 hypothetical protein AMSG_09691 [Thecamonas trahens ATCC 50062]